MPNLPLLAKAVPVSANDKIGRVATTWAGFTSCPSTCPFQVKARVTGRNDCYAGNGMSAWQTGPLTASAIAAGATPIDIARAEAAAIDTLPGTRDLRLHTAGDCVDAECAAVVAAACARYVARGLAKGKTPLVWGYTHAWREIPRDVWGVVSILASCHRVNDAHKAMARGYAVSLTVDAYPNGARAFRQDGLKIIPCRNTVTKHGGGVKVSCSECRLCMHADRLLQTGCAIGFSAEGFTTVSDLEQYLPAE